MSKVGKKKIYLSKSNKILLDNNLIKISGKIGSLSLRTFKFINISLTSKYLVLYTKIKIKKNVAFIGLFRSIINNILYGVNYGYLKILELKGIGFKTYMNKSFLVFSLGYSHDVIYHFPKNIIIRSISNKIEIFSCDKQLVGQVSSDIRNLKRINSYKVKGIKYLFENIVTKIGKKK